MPNSLITNEVNYNQYRSYLLNNEIHHIQYGQDDKIVFWLKGDESGLNKFWTGLDKSEKEDWVKYNVSNIEIKPKEGLGLIDVIFNLAPCVIIILFCTNWLQPLIHARLVLGHPDTVHKLLWSFICVLSF